MPIDDVLQLLRSVPPSTYLYPDAALALDAMLPATKREGERTLWLEALTRAFGDERPIRGAALDAGCGEGEHLPRLAERFEAVVGLEPDARRLESARRRSPTVPSFGLELDAPVLADPRLAGSFRFAQCLQVLGHIPCAAAERQLATLARLVEPGGAVLLALPYTNEFGDECRIARATESRSVSPAEYDAFVPKATEGSLPVRHFAMPSIARLLEQAGLEQVWSAPYGWLNYQLADLMVLARRR